MEGNRRLEDRDVLQETVPKVKEYPQITQITQIKSLES